MDIAAIFECYERVGEASGVRVLVADVNRESGRSGFGAGLIAAQRMLLRDAMPTLLVGMDSKDAMAARGFGPLLGLSFVRYLEMPCGRAEVMQAVELLRGTASTAAELHGVRASVTAHGIEAIRRNVTHRLEGATRAVLRTAVRAITEVVAAQGAACDGAEILKDFAAPLRSTHANFKETLVILREKIGELDGICPEGITETLKCHSVLLSEACVDLAHFAAGISDWECGKAGSNSLAALAPVGERVIKILAVSACALASLSERRGAP